MTRKNKAALIFACFVACWFGVAAQSLIRLTSQVTGILPVANGGTALDHVTPCSEGISQFSTSDTLSNTGTSEQVFSTKCTIAANYFTTNTTVRVSVTFDYKPTATVPTNIVKMKLCTVSGCGSGTVKTIYLSVSDAPGAATINSGGWTYLIIGAATPGASVAIESAPVGYSARTVQTVGRWENNQATQVTGVPTNGTLYLQFSVTYGTSTDGNTPMTLTEMVVESLN